LIGPIAASNRNAVALGHESSPDIAALAALTLAVRLDRQVFPRSDCVAVRRRLAEVSAECPDAAWVAPAVTRAANGVDAAIGVVAGPGMGP
jgi:hypothetical protein